MKRAIIILSMILFAGMGFSQDWKLAIQTWTFHTTGFIESVDKADSLGIKYVEAYPGQKVGGSIPGTFNYTLDKDARFKLKHYLNWMKIKVIAYGVVDKDYYQTRANIEKYFMFCRDMNIPVMTAEPEWEDIAEFEWLSKKYNVKVAIHCHPKPSHYWDIDSMLLGLKKGKSFGAWPDIGHWTRTGVNATEGLKKLEGKVWGLHFKDVKEFDKNNSGDVLFGEGATNLPGVLKELKRQKFRGYLVLEYEAHPENNMEDMRKNILFYKAELQKLSANQ